MTIIEAIELRMILDSRGNPTVEAEISTAGGFGRAAAPSGASTGAAEAKVLPPREAIDHAIQDLIPALIGMDASDQESFDDQLRDIDGTLNFSGIGSNVAVALSLANAKAAASALGLPLFRISAGRLSARCRSRWGTLSAAARSRSGAADVVDFFLNGELLECGERQREEEADSAVENEKASRKARAISSGVPFTAAGSGIPQCAVMGWPGQ